MDRTSPQFEKADSLAREILKLARNTLLINLRFLDMALSEFDYLYAPDMVGTDGKNLYYDPRLLLRAYKKDKNSVTRLYLHSLVHCICRHMFAPATVDRPLWDLACDMATEHIVADLDFSGQPAADQSAMHYELRKFEDKPGQLTAERIYTKLKSGRVTEEKIAQLRALFVKDDHRLWYQRLDYGKTLSEEEGEPPEEEPVQLLQKAGGDHSDANTIDTDELEATGYVLADSGEEEKAQLLDPKKELERFWKDVSERLQTDLETTSLQFGEQAGSLLQNLREVNREKYDYSAFLRKFAVMGESMVINDDEFDYIYYTYGMKLFGNMPLIEPLEYKQVKRIREFVIAIDTSGSVRGELVQRFVQKTYNILKQQETFFTRINLHIIQCDAAIQEDVKITTQQEFDRYLQTMQLHGMGGTDYRPVFDYVEKLRQNHEFTNLKGLIYFTDGFGAYPAKQPDYPTAFVFVNDDLANPQVPVWAIKLILQSQDI